MLPRKSQHHLNQTARNVPTARKAFPRQQSNALIAHPIYAGESRAKSLAIPELKKHKWETKNS
jgi:hypothetical protein